MTTQSIPTDRIKLGPIGFQSMQQFFKMGASEVFCYPQEDGSLKVVGRVFDGCLSLNLPAEDWSV